MLTKEQAEFLKKQLVEQIEATFPEDKKHFALERIKDMNDEELENFLIKNGLAHGQGSSPQCVFCSIVSGKIESVKIGSNEDAIAVLEINPASRGHTIIIPSDHLHSERAEQGVLTLEKEVSKILKQKLKPKKVLSHKSNLFGHDIVSLIPQYNNETNNSPKQPSNLEELRKIQRELSENEDKKSDPKAKPESKEKPTTSLPQEEKFWLPRRIP